MAILEYEPGAAFPGVIGRTAEEDPTSLTTPQGGGSAATLRRAAPGAAAIDGFTRSE
jgi:hypothetical protein